MPKKSKRFLGIGRLKKRYNNCSHMFIERLLKNDPTFPRPRKLAPGIMAHRTWDEDELEAWERSRIVRARSDERERRGEAAQMEADSETG